MSVIFRQLTLRIPGNYVWTKPPTGVGAGPFGSTYQQTIVTCIGAGSGGASGAAANNVGTAVIGGTGGGAGGYAQVTYLPTDLTNAFENISVAAGTLGGPAQQTSGSITSSVNSVDSLAVTGNSAFGTRVRSTGGASSSAHGNNGNVSTVTGGTNVTNIRGGCSSSANASAIDQLGLGLNVLLAGAIATCTITQNNAGGAGGCASSTLAIRGGNGANINGVGGGRGINNSTATAGSGTAGSAGGGGSGSLAGLFNIVGGPGANGAPNSGSGGGGGGAGGSINSATGGLIISGAGGNGAHGAVQVTDIFFVPPPTNVQYYNWDKVTWFHMMNMARPISLTGRYKS